MAESMLMSRDEIAAADAALDPGRDAPASKGNDKPAKDAEPDIEYVGPDADDGDEGEGPTSEADGKPEAKAPEKPGDKGKKEDRPKPPEGFVDRNALVAEREARRRADEQHAAYRRQTEEKLNILLGQIAQINQQTQQAQRPAQQDQAAEIRWEDDPAAFTQKNFEKLRREQEELRQYLAGQQQQTRQQTEQQQAIQYYTNAITVSEQQVAQQVPDYYPAVTALRAARMAELAEMPQFRGNPQAVEAQLQREALHLAEQAVKSGEPPAATYYRLALARGWRPEMAQQMSPQAQQAAGQAEAKNNRAAAEIERLAKAKEASEGLSNSGGSAPSANRMSLESFDRMSNKEISAWIARETKKNGPGAVDAALAKMMGAGR